LYEQSTTEANGVKMILPVIYHDRFEFVAKMKEQLAYFDNVYFDVYDENIKNDFIIFRGEDFQYSQLIKTSEMHLCLDNVYYPIDFKKLGINVIQFPLALRFSLSEGLTPIPNREQLMYSLESKKAILAKIGKVANFFAERYNASITEEADIHAIMEFYSNQYKPVKGFNNDIYQFTQLEKFSTVQLLAPKLAGVSLLDLRHVHLIREYILGEYDNRYVLRNGTMRECKTSWQKDLHINSLNNTHYLYADKISGVKKEWLKTLPTNNGYSKTFVKKERFFRLGKLQHGTNYKTYVTLCQLKNYPKSQWRDVIKEFQYIQSLFLNMLIDLDALDIPQDWLDRRQAIKDAAKVKLGLVPGVKRVKLQGEITGKEACVLERYVSGKNAKFVPNVYQLKDFHQRKRLTVYGKADDAELMDKLFSIFKQTTFVQFSDRELKRLEGVKIHNLISLTEFMEGKNKVFQRVATAELIRGLRKKHENVFNKKSRLLGVSKDLHDKLEVLSSYERKYRDYNADSTTIAAILEVAIQNNMFDEPIKMLHDDIKALFNKLPFLEPLFYEMSSYSASVNDKDRMTDTLCSLFKYHRQRVDWKNYKVTLILDEDISEELTEAAVEELLED
jgi:hypothetical protein